MDYAEKIISINQVLLLARSLPPSLYLSHTTHAHILPKGKSVRPHIPLRHRQGEDTGRVCQMSHLLSRGSEILESLWDAGAQSSGFRVGSRLGVSGVRVQVIPKAPGPAVHTLSLPQHPQQTPPIPMLALTRDVISALGVAALGHRDLGHLLPRQGAVQQLVIVYLGWGVLPLHIQGVLRLVCHPRGAKHSKI